jgi:hypothetical protein
MRAISRGCGAVADSQYAAGFEYAGEYERQVESQS